MREGGKQLRRLAVAAALLIAAAAPARGQSSPPCGTPTALDDGWSIATPESAGLDSAPLCAIAARLKEIDANVHAVVIVRHGKLVFEQYFAGPDERWLEAGVYDHDATTRHDMRSASKSVISLLVGIAIDRKLIASAEKPVVKFFPDYASVKSAGWDQVTIRHLLTMSSGMQWDENRGWKDPKNDEPHLAGEADPMRYILSKPIAAPPGTVWTYSGGATDLLGSILERVSGKPLEAFAREALFDPLGISDWEWMKYGNGKVASAIGLRARPRDAAKIGQMVLNRGAWGGKQIVASEWIDQSVRPRHQAIGYFGGMMFYGQQWWLGRSMAREKEVKWIAAQGSGGQRLFIVPDRDMVVMTTSGRYFQPRQGDGALDMMANFILPSVRD